jgi:thiamine-phosphate diphosphorylase
MAVVADARAGLRAADRGATVVQLRAPGATVRQMEREAAALVEEATIAVLVSARADVALAVGAAGVHLPEGDMAPRDVRWLLGGERLIGRSVHGPPGAAELDGTDYLIAGPVYETPSHAGKSGRGLAWLRQVVAASPVPVVAIGGVFGERIQGCLDAGAAGFASIRAFAG